MRLGIGERRDRIWVELVGGDYFDVLGTGTQLGRTLRTGDEGMGGDAVAVLADALWRHKFEADPEILGGRCT